MASVLSGGGGSSQPQYVTTTQNSAPWSAQQPFLTRGFEEAKRIYESDQPQYFPGSTVVPFSPQSEQALRMQENRALSGSPLQNMASQQQQDTVSGAFLGGNPFFDGAFNAQVRPAVDRFTQEIAPGIDSSFSAAGRFGSNAYAQSRNRAEDTFARALTDTAGQLAYGNYANERGMQQASAMNAPAFAQADYNDAQRLAGVGAAREDMGQAQLADEIARFNFNQNREANKLGQYMALIGGGYGSSNTTAQPYFRNPAASFLGGAASGAGIGNMIGGSAGAGIGALAGGLLGGFG